MDAESEAPSTWRRRRSPMQHSHEALDRPGGVTRVGLLLPLRERQFRRLWVAMCVSLLGDGAFLVAVAWQVYDLSQHTPRRCPWWVSP